jgi:hypothetical protein
MSVKDDPISKKRRREDRALKIMCKCLKQNSLTSEQLKKLNDAILDGQENKAREALCTMTIGTRVKFYKKKHGWIHGQMLKAMRKYMKIVLPNGDIETIRASLVYRVTDTPLPLPSISPPVKVETY